MAPAERDAGATCRCGATALSTLGAPIAAASCHCASCTTAARRFEDEGAGPLIGADGGVDYVLFRKDRVGLLRGRKNLAGRRLTPDASTRRVVATCCGTPMFADYAPGHWLSLYRAAMAADPPAPGMRTYTVPFFLRLLGAWMAMRFRRPTLPF